MEINVPGNQFDTVEEIHTIVLHIFAADCESVSERERIHFGN